MENKVIETINKYLDVELYELYDDNGVLSVILYDLFDKGRNFYNDCLSIFTELFYHFDVANYQKLDDGKVLITLQ